MDCRDVPILVYYHRFKFGDRNVKRRHILACRKEKHNLTDAKIAEYLNQGFNIHEVDKAFRLSEKSRVSVEQILKKRKEGARWESLIEKYNREEGKETE